MLFDLSQSTSLKSLVSPERLPKRLTNRAVLRQSTVLKILVDVLGTAVRWGCQERVLDVTLVSSLLRRMRTKENLSMSWLLIGKKTYAVRVLLQNNGAREASSVVTRTDERADRVGFVVDVENGILGLASVRACVFCQSGNHPAIVLDYSSRRRHTFESPLWSRRSPRTS